MCGLNPCGWCCTARTGAKTVAILNLVLGGMQLIFFGFSLVYVKSEYKILAMLSIILLIIDMAANCTLLSGVNQGDIRKCKIWIFIELLWLTGGAIQMVFNGLYTSSTELEPPEFQAKMFGFFCGLLFLLLEIWIVNAYIKKLEREQLGLLGQPLQFIGQNGFVHSKPEDATGFMQGPFPGAIFTIQSPIGIHAESVYETNEPPPPYHEAVSGNIPPV